jgi:hypothetical protein
VPKSAEVAIATYELEVWNTELVGGRIKKHGCDWLILTTAQIEFKSC